MQNNINYEVVKIGWLEYANSDLIKSHGYFLLYFIESENKSEKIENILKWKLTFWNGNC